jgi:CheY-like chemotaxis protein
MSPPDPGDVLVVDDDPDMRDVITDLLQDAGYEVRCAENGERALAAAAARRPALVLLDMLMPVMDGRRCARELRAAYGRGLPIVVVTAAEHALASTREIEVDDVLRKPFDVHDLLRVVGRHAPPPDGAAAAPRLR